MRFSRFLPVCGLLAGLLASNACARVVYVNRAATGGNNGGSWSDAYLKIADALNGAQQNDEVWVAAGTYKENLHLPNNVALYGGFAGTEANRDDRNPAVNFTSIDGQRLHSVVEMTFGAGPQTRIDGFRIKGGQDNNGGAGGGGIYVNNLVTGTISNNVITENIGQQGAAIVVQYGSPTIANNLISGNMGGGPGITGFNGSTVIVNNTIVNNHALPNMYGGESIALFGQTNAVIANNVVANNDQGVYVSGDSSYTIAGNDVFGNDNRYNGIADPTGINGNISADPLFLDATDGDYRVTSASPAVNAGANAFAAGPRDLDNTARIQNTAVDMGAYERGTTDLHLVFTANPAGSTPGAPFTTQPVVAVVNADGVVQHFFNGAVTISIDPGSGADGAMLGGTAMVNAVNGVAAFTDLAIDRAGSDYALDAAAPGALPAQTTMFNVALVRYYVSKSGSDDNDGLSWDNAKLTVQNALDTGGTAGGEIWVAKGAYQENLSLDGVTDLYGGFAGTETALSDRDLAMNATTLDGGGGGRVVTSQQPAALRTLDGFTVQNGSASGAEGGGVYADVFSGTIANNTFTHNSADSGGALGLTLSNNPVAVPAFSNNTFTSNTARYDGAVYVLNPSSDQNSAPKFTGNTFANNSAARGGGLFVDGIASLASCTFTANTAPQGGAVCEINNTLYLDTCTFSGNGVSASATDAGGGAVYLSNGGLQANNCQFTNNHVSAASGKAALGGAVGQMNTGYGVYMYGCALSGNTAGQGGAVGTSGTGTVNLTHCTVTGNTASANGGGISIFKAPFHLEDNLIVSNSAGTYGGGLSLDKVPVLYNRYSERLALNNTITGNNASAGGAGVDLRDYAYGQFTNNLIAFNGSGIQADATSGGLFRSNDVYGNGSNFTGLAAFTGTFGNISADPLFMNRSTGDYHLSAGSPAADAGDDTTINLYTSDLDNKPRVQGARVDIGAYEFTAPRIPFLQFYASPNGAAAPGLLSLEPTIVVDNPDGSRDTTFNGSVTISLKPGTGTGAATLGGTTTVQVVDGYAVFPNLAIDKGGTNYVLTATAPGASPADSNPITMTVSLVRVSPTGSDLNDGSSWALAKRTLQQAGDETSDNGSVWVAAGTYYGVYQFFNNLTVLGGFAGTETTATQRSPAVNVTTLDGLALRDIIDSQGGGTGTPTYDGFTFTNSNGAGILVFGSGVTASNDVFTGNNGGFGAGILAFGASNRISHNRFTGNNAGISGGGLYLVGGVTTLDNNLFAGNTAPQDGSAITLGGGATVTIRDNTIAGNTGPNGALNLSDATATLVNNIVANNTSGIVHNANSNPVTLRNNDVFNNAAFNYLNVTAGANSLSVDPLFANAPGGDYRLAFGSPAIDAGDDTVLTAGELDLAGAARKQGAHVDLGAFEYVSGTFSAADAIRALKIAGGLVKATSADVARLNVDNTTTSANKVDLRDATRLMRKAAGKDSNP